MFYLKEANYKDIEKEYAYITALPEDENGFTNPDCGCSFEEFKNRILPGYLDHAKGKNLKEGYVPSGEYFLWKEDEIVGLFRIRHYLNDALRNGSGHIGYSVKKEERGKGYATKGLALTIQKAFGIVPEEELYLSVNKDNPASLAVMLKTVLISIMKTITDTIRGSEERTKSPNSI